MLLKRLKKSGSTELDNQKSQNFSGERKKHSIKSKSQFKDKSKVYCVVQAVLLNRGQKKLE